MKNFAAKVFTYGLLLFLTVIVVLFAISFLVDIDFFTDAALVLAWLSWGFGLIFYPGIALVALVMFFVEMKKGKAKRSNMRLTAHLLSVIFAAGLFVFSYITFPLGV